MTLSPFSAACMDMSLENMLLEHSDLEQIQEKKVTKDLSMVSSNHQYWKCYIGQEVIQPDPLQVRPQLVRVGLVQPHKGAFFINKSGILGTLFQVDISKKEFEVGPDVVSSGSKLFF